jgi:mannose-6-phosphate isomerase-like protein (cupin superfamily)
MNRKTIYLPCLAIAGFLAGYALSQSGKVLAQSSSRPGQPGESAIPAPPLRQPVPLWADQPEKCNYWSVDDIRKAHAALVAADAAGKPLSGPVLKDMPLQTRTHVYFIEHRAAGKPALAEAHEGASDFYVIMGGTGTIVTGGEIENRKNFAGPAGPIPGEYRGSAIRGGQTFKVKEGDWVSVPPGVPVQSTSDAGGLTYLVLRINVGLYPWSLIPRS